jgi:protein-S-isoprenylcysteine O-methyltransferase Ste14
MIVSARPLPFVFPYALVFWAVFLWAFTPEFAIVKRAQRAQTATDSKSLQVIMLGQFAASLAAFWVAWFSAVQFPAAFRAASFFVGVGLTIAGSLLRRHCFRMLGGSFTGDVRVRPDQDLVTRGAYRVLRHPSYTAGVLMNLGIGVALGSWLSMLLLGIGSFAVYVYRMSVEERALLAGIGEPYRRFMQNRKRLIPYLY